MASCGYHSPQFSEDIAWLPAWLQPHQLPALGDVAKNDHASSQLSCKSLASIPKNISTAQDNQFFTNGDSRYASCRLYLSGDGNSSGGSIPSSAEALNFRLHLSSLDISQLSTSQDNEICQPCCHEKNEGSIEKYVPDIRVDCDGKICQHTVEDEAHISASPMRNKSRMLGKRKHRPLVKPDQKNQLRSRGRHDVDNICKTDINDAVELSIAASEAMVISDMVNELHYENLPAATILEITLRVKQARKECNLDIVEAAPSVPVDELDEDDLLSDLDENIMADAFDDVGISLNQIVESPDSSHYSTKFLQSNQSSDPTSHISESQFGIHEEAESNKLSASVTIVNGANFRQCAAVTVGSTSKFLPLQTLPAQHTKPSVFVPIECMKSSLNNQQKVDTKNLEDNTDASIPNQTSCKEDGEIHKDGKVTSMANMIMMKGLRAFNMETSFISESMDEIYESKADHVAEAEPEIVASSSAPFRDLPTSPYKESESTHERHHQDFVRSSNFSQIDPLCSVVPCSITSEYAPISCDPTQEVIKDDGEKFKEPKGGVSSKELNEKCLMSDVQKTPLFPLAERSFVLSGNSIEIPVVPRRKQFNSLRHYSMITPEPNIYNPIPSQCIAKQSMMFPSAERNNICFMSNKSDDEGCLKPIHGCTDVEEFQYNQGQEKVGRTCVNGDAENDDSGASIHHQEDMGIPIILDIRKHHLRSCKKILNSGSEDKSTEKPSASKIRLCKNSTDEVNGGDLTNYTSLPLQSILHSCTDDKQSFRNKRVRFLESKCSMDRTKGNNRLQSKHRTHGSHQRCSKRAKEPSQKMKSVTRRKENYNNLTCQHVVREKGMIFQGLEFLLTGFSRQREKELEALIRQYAGYVLINIPSNYPDLRGKKQAQLAQFKLPIVLSPKKVQTAKFLYGCATNAWMLNAHWLVDSIQAASLLPPGRYMTRLVEGSELNQLRIGGPFCSSTHSFIFERVGIMLNGKVSFCTKFSKIIKHGGGHVFKSLQRLVQSLKKGVNVLGVVLVESEGNVSRHLKHCALENNLQTVPASWIVNSLFSGKLLPLKKDRCAPLHRIKMPTFSIRQDDNMSEEI